MPIEESWLSRLKEKGFTKDNPFFNVTLEPLKMRLLKIAGQAVVLPGVEDDLENIMTRGRYFSGKSWTKRGADSQCHFNSAACWDANQGVVNICTGYALSRDGVWRQHSWCYHIKGKRVVETTLKRACYFGYVLNDKEAADFYYSNL